MPLMLFPDEDGSPEFNEYKKWMNKSYNEKGMTFEQRLAWKRALESTRDINSVNPSNLFYSAQKTDSQNLAYLTKGLERPSYEHSKILMMTPEERAIEVRKMSRNNLPANIQKPPYPPETGFSAFPTEDGKPMYMQEYQGGYHKGNYPNEYIKKMPSNHFGEWDAVTNERVFDKTSATTSYFKQKGPNSYQPMWRNAAASGQALSGLSKANLFLNAALVPAQIADQASAAAGWDGNTTLDREYGRSDPLSIRPNIDAFLNTPPWDLGASFGIPYTREGKAAEAAYQARVNDPEYIYRNPMSSMVGQAARGNMDYAKAFANEYLPKDYQLRYSDSPSNRERVGLYKR